MKIREKNIAADYNEFKVGLGVSLKSTYLSSAHKALDFFLPPVFENFYMYILSCFHHLLCMYSLCVEFENFSLN